MKKIATVLIFLRKSAGGEGLYSPVLKRGENDKVGLIFFVLDRITFERDSSRDRVFRRVANVSRGNLVRLTAVKANE